MDNINHEFESIRGQQLEIESEKKLWTALNEIARAVQCAREDGRSSDEVSGYISYDTKNLILNYLLHTKVRFPLDERDYILRSHGNYDAQYEVIKELY